MAGAFQNFQAAKKLKTSIERHCAARPVELGHHGPRPFIDPDEQCDSKPINEILAVADDKEEVESRFMRVTQMLESKAAEKSQPVSAVWLEPTCWKRKQCFPPKTEILFYQTRATL